MIVVRTPTGRLSHLASSTSAERTFCGIRFHPEIDSVMPYVRMPAGVCQSCLSGRKRRELRSERLRTFGAT